MKRNMPFTDASLLLRFNFLTPFPVEDSSITEDCLLLQKLITLPPTRNGKIKFRKTVSFEVCIGIIFKQIHNMGDFAEEKLFLTIHVISKIIISWRALF